MADRVAAYAPDLMDQSRIAAVAPDVRFVSTPDELRSTDASTVVVDLGRPGVLDVLPDVRGRTIGFGSHVDEALLAAARAAGCDEVLPRSRFFARLDQLLD